MLMLRATSVPARRSYAMLCYAMRSHHVLMHTVNVNRFKGVSYCSTFVSVTDGSCHTGCAVVR